LPEIYKKFKSLSREDLIKHFVSAEFNRFLDYYKNAKDLNNAESSRDGRREGRGERQRGSRKERGRNSFTRLYINIGEKNKLNPARLIGLINEGLDSDTAEIGKIEILKSFSFFEIENTMDNKLIESLKGKKFDDTPLLVEVSQGKSEGGYSKEKSDRSSSKRKYSGKKSFGDRSKFGNKRNKDKKGGRGKRKQW